MKSSIADHPSVSASLCENSLRDLAELVAGSISVKDAFRSVSRRVCRFLNSEGARLLLLDRDRKHLVEAAAWGHVDVRAVDADELPTRSFYLKRIMLGHGASTATVPLTRGTEVIGVLQIYFRDSDTLRGQLLAALGSIQELVSPVIVRSMVYEHNIAAAHLDAITELPNERAFNTAFERMIAEAHRKNCSPSIIVFDIKNFAVINERLGHVGGDAILRWVAQIARHNLRDMDIIARSRSDEFMVVLPTASAEETQAIISRIRNGMSKEEPPAEIAGIKKVELNFGWAVFGSDGDLNSSLLARARLRKNLFKTRPAIHNVLLFPSAKTADPCP